MTEPTIQWVGTDGRNMTPGREGHAPIAIINHIMLGTLNGTREAFRDPAHKASAHFGLGPDGTIYQFVKDEDMAWANGNLRAPQTWIKWIAAAQKTETNPNLLTISIEWAGRHTGGRWVKVSHGGKVLETLERGSVEAFWQPTETQYQAGLWLHRQLIARHGIAVDREHIGRHSDLDGVAKWFCPGDGFPLARLLADLGAK
jgi:N-acetyl-anhydromuramyl-L-alanine amidase AmpD